MFFIFDWDGTLCDSTPKIVRSMQRASTKVGLPVLSDEEVLEIIGLGLPEAIAQLYPGVLTEQALALRVAYSECFLLDDATPSLLFDGVEETLHTLRDQGFPLSVATGKSRRGLNRVLEQMGMTGFFHASRCADETASKPDPRMLNELLSELRHHPEKALMVGDTEYDMAMAQNASVGRVAVSYGAHHIDRLKAYKPVLCIDQFNQILTLVSGGDSVASNIKV